MGKIERIANSITAAIAFSKVYYRVMDEANKMISVIFFIGGAVNVESFSDWVNTITSKKDELTPIAKKYGFIYSPNTTDVGAYHRLDGMMFTLVFNGRKDADLEGFKQELFNLYNCQKLKS